MFGSAHGAIRLPHNLVCLDLRRRYRVPRYLVSARQEVMLIMDHIPRCMRRALGMSFSYTIGLFTCLKSSCLKRGLLGRDLRLEVRRNRPGASRNRHGYVLWLDLLGPHTVMLLLMRRSHALARTHKSFE
jgi:hypothetical protein